MAGVKTQKAGAVNGMPPRIVLTSHSCTSCGERIMSNEVASVLELHFTGGKKQRLRAFYHKAHSPKA
jgi:hypothetical protein